MTGHSGGARRSSLTRRADVQLVPFSEGERKVVQLRYGLIDGRLTARDDETTDAAATLFASSVGAAVRSATADRP